MSAATDPDEGGAEGRGARLAAAVAAVRARIAGAAAAAGRDPAAVTLVVVTKDHPAPDAAALARSGVVDLGESREQHLRAVAAELSAGAGVPPVTWHFVGRLQRNKAASVGRLAAVVHSVDDARLLAPLARGAGEAGRECACLVQVSLDGDPQRGGVPLDGVARLADEVAGTPGVRLRGLMAVAPLGADPGAAFDALAAASAALAASHPEATWVSAGMSGDLEAAVARGATHVRVGTAVLGPRPAAR